MKIIDPTTGKRKTDFDKQVNKSLKESDPIQRKAEKAAEMQEHSPMDPPDAYEGGVTQAVSYDEMDVILQQFMDEHKAGTQKVDQFEKALSTFKENGYLLNEDINEAFSEFFRFFDNQLLDHNQREEKRLFPLLHQKLLASGEHSDEDPPTTAVDMMEDDHIKFIQLGTLAFNMLGLAVRLKDNDSRLFVYDMAYNNGRELCEMIRLHIYREENILFPMAHHLISKEEFMELNS